MRSHHHLLVVLLLSLAAAAARRSELDPSIRNFVFNVCNQTDYKTACVNSARFYADSYRVVDLDAMLEMHVRMASARLQAAKSAALRIAAQPSTSRTVKEDVDYCIKTYDDVSDCFEVGLTAEKNGDAGTASSNLSSVFSFITACNATAHPTLNSLKRNNKIVKKLASNSLAILSLKKSSSAN